MTRGRAPIGGEAYRVRYEYESGVVSYSPAYSKVGSAKSHRTTKLRQFARGYRKGAAPKAVVEASALVWTEVTE